MLESKNMSVFQTWKWEWGETEKGKGKRKQPRHFLFSHRRSRISPFSDPKNGQRFGQSSAERHTRTACSTLLSEHTYTKETTWCQDSVVPAAEGVPLKERIAEPVTATTIRHNHDVVMIAQGDPIRPQRHVACYTVVRSPEASHACGVASRPRSLRGFMASSLTSMRTMRAPFRGPMCG